MFAPDPTIVEIHRILEGLRERRFVDRLQRSSIPEETAWAFCQPLERRMMEGDGPTQETRRRQAFAAQWLESRGGPGRDQRLEALARLYEQAGDRRRAAYCFVTAGGLARDRLLLDRAHALYLAGIRLLELDDAVTKMDALYAAADVAARLGRTREAVGLFQEMLLLAWRLDLPAKGGAAHGRIGRLLSTLGDNGGALAHLELAHTLFEVAGDGPGIAATLDDIGRILFLMGEPERSLERHRSAAAVREQLGDDRGRALTLSRLGQVLRQTGSLAAAGEHFRAALDLRRRVGDRAGRDRFAAGPGRARTRPRAGRRGSALAVGGARAGPRGWRAPSGVQPVDRDGRLPPVHRRAARGAGRAPGGARDCPPLRRARAAVGSHARHRRGGAGPGRGGARA